MFRWFQTSQEVVATKTSHERLIEFLEKEGLKDQASNLRNNATTLDLRYRGIGDNGAKEIANALKENKSLTLLSLSYNKIGDAGATSLAASLKDNNSLTSLDLDNNNAIGEATLKIINGYLQRNKTIAEKKEESLNVEANDLYSQEKYNEAIEKYKAAIKITKESLRTENKLYEENKAKAEKNMKNSNSKQ